jgi:hypothetical protein
MEIKLENGEVIEVITLKEKQYQEIMDRVYTFELLTQRF